MKKINILLYIMLSTLLFSSCAEKAEEENITDFPEYTHSIETEYAEMFSVDCYEGGYASVKIEGEGEFLVVPENMPVPETNENVTILQQPIDNIYLTAVSVYDMMYSLGESERVTLTGTKKSGWYLDGAVSAMEEGKMQYAGKYSAPDYETILSEKCGLVAASTMMNHTPEVIENFEKFGIPVLIDKANYESHPLGKMEWIKLYGVLFDKEEEAENIMEEKIKHMENLLESKEKRGKSVVFFYITENDNINVRKSDDYIVKMIEMAGGEYVFKGEELKIGNSSSINLQIEEFYAKAKDADVLIYNSTMGDGIKSIDELLDKNSLFGDFKAVKNGQVWCMSKKMHQKTMSITDVITEFNIILQENADDENLEFIMRAE